MTETQIRFDDGAGYERMMGVWTRIAGKVFLEWLAPDAGLKWIDIGCGNGAFTELIVDECAPASVDGIDPSAGQLAFARTRPAARVAQFHLGDAQALPFEAARFDAAVMALVIFFVPDPVRGVAEMVRVTRPGGLVAAYAWDILDGGFPLEPIYAVMRVQALPIAHPPSAEASRLEAMRGLWRGAGLEAIETREITVQRTFASFEDFWTTALLSAGLRTTLEKTAPAVVDQLKQAVRAKLSPDAAGRITTSARANAVKGYVPK